MDGNFNLVFNLFRGRVDINLIYMCRGVRGNKEFDADVKERKSSQKYKCGEINWQIENSKNAWWIISGIQTSHSNFETVDV